MKINLIQSKAQKLVVSELECDRFTVIIYRTTYFLTVSPGTTCKAQTSGEDMEIVINMQYEITMKTSIWHRVQ